MMIDTKRITARAAEIYQMLDDEDLWERGEILSIVNTLYELDRRRDQVMKEVKKGKP